MSTSFWKTKGTLYQLTRKQTGFTQNQYHSTETTWWRLTAGLCSTGADLEVGLNLWFLFTGSGTALITCLTAECGRPDSDPPGRGWPLIAAFDRTKKLTEWNLAEMTVYTYVYSIYKYFWKWGYFGHLIKKKFKVFFNNWFVVKFVNLVQILFFILFFVMLKKRNHTSLIS